MQLTVAQPCVVTSVLTQRDAALNSGPRDRLAPDLIVPGLVTCTTTDTQYAGVRVPRSVRVGKTTATVGGRAMSTAPAIIGGCTMIPLHFVAEKLGYLGWLGPQQERYGRVPWTE